MKAVLTTVAAAFLGMTAVSAGHTEDIKDMHNVIYGAKYNKGVKEYKINYFEVARSLIANNKASAKGLAEQVQDKHMEMFPKSNTRPEPTSFSGAIKHHAAKITGTPQRNLANTKASAKGLAEQVQDKHMEMFPKSNTRPEPTSFSGAIKHHAAKITGKVARMLANKEAAKGLAEQVQDKHMEMFPKSNTRPEPTSFSGAIKHHAAKITGKIARMLANKEAAKGLAEQVQNKHMDMFPKSNTRPEPASFNGAIRHHAAKITGKTN